jgi:hypothetical protein
MKDPNACSSSYPRWKVLILLVTVATLVFYWIGDIAEHASPVDLEVRDNYKDTIISTLTATNHTSVLSNASIHLTDSELDLQTLLDAALAAHSQLMDALHVDYGEFFAYIFRTNNNDSQQPQGMTPLSRNSKKRFKQKLQLKILLARTSSPSSSRFVWATGGHSAAAGHGNLYNESYTAFLERHAQGVFQAVGIDLEARNYAMGATQSAAEISMCSQAIFGTDVDILSWDYGMTDGKNHDEYLLHYGYRAALGPSFPVLVCVRGCEGKKSPRRQRLKELEDRGMAVFVAPDNKVLRDAIPDTLGMSAEEIGQLAEYVQNFKCHGHIESGEPFCDREKYNHYVCPNRKQKKSWHPGL